MTSAKLAYDPYNLIIAGVGGQGNVLASRIVGNMLAQKGFFITIGETFGGSQRGGSVMSHLRISSDSAHSPLIPKGQAHMIISLEPTETLRVLNDYGNPETRVIVNMRPIHPVQVISGELSYPTLEDVKKWVEGLTGGAWYLEATDTAVKLGSPILGNIIMIGALAGLDELPLDREDLREVISRTMTPDKVEANLGAYDVGMSMVQA